MAGGEEPLVGGVGRRADPAGGPGASPPRGHHGREQEVRPQRAPGHLDRPHARLSQVDGSAQLVSGFGDQRGDGLRVQHRELQATQA